MLSVSVVLGQDGQLLSCLSTAEGGTEGDLEDFDLDINALDPYTGGNASHKHYKSFQPSIKLQPSDLVYREENSRAAPRKGIEVKLRFWSRLLLN